MSEALLKRLWALHTDPGSDGEGFTDALGIDEGQRVQVALMRRFLERGERIGGWKVGMTSGTSRNAMGQGVRPFGFVLASRILPSGARLSLATLARGGVENELCLVLGAPLGAQATTASARSAVVAVAPAFEINQRRLPANAQAGLRIADDLSNWGMVVGEPVDPPERLGDLTVTLCGNGRVLGRVPSEGHIDDHYASLAALARGLAAHGLELAAGQKVITGAYARTPFAQGHYRGEFDLGIGDVELEITP